MNDFYSAPRPTEAEIGALISLYQQGRLDAALASGEVLVQRFPDAPFLLNLFGAINAASGRLERAAESIARAAELKPDFAEAHYNLGNVLDRLGRTRDAIASYTNALKLKPDFANAYNDLGAGLQELGMAEAAVASYRKAVHFRPDFAEAHNNLGAALDFLKRPSDAVDHLQKALELRPAYAEAANNLGAALVHLGRADEAAASFARAIELAPRFAEAHRNLSALKHYTSDDPHIGAMQDLLSAEHLAGGDRVLLNFALGKAWDDVAKHDAAFACFVEGNRLQRPTLDYDAFAVREKHARLIATFSDAVPEPHPAGLAGSEAQKRVVFIVGMPRSGTTLVEQILASHSDVHGAGELELLEQVMQSVDWGPAHLNAAQLRSIRETYLSGIAKLAAAQSIAEPVVTDKMPFNFWWLGFLLAAIPEARIVHVTRDARATCWSIFRHYFPGRGIGFACDLEELAAYYRFYVDIMEFWHERFPGRIYDLGYERLTENQTDETRMLLDYLGLEWQDRCLEFHRTDRANQTISAAQVRRPLYRDSSTSWRPYERHLGSLIRQLEGL